MCFGQQAATIIVEKCDNSNNSCKGDYTLTLQVIISQNNIIYLSIPDKKYKLLLSLLVRKQIFFTTCNVS